MKVYLAGYNLDAEVIEEFKQANPTREDITPETLSAAYARISRYPQPINELRALARQEVAKSRKSNEVIIFGLGHSSVAEHANFNFDVINVSRLAMEELEKFRLCSYTEKSQRYITLEDDYLVPQEIVEVGLEADFKALVAVQNAFYHELFAKLKEHIYVKHADLAKDPKNTNLLEGWAKEDARYITSLATFSQAGMTLNARNLEKMLRRFSASKLSEVRELGQKLHALVKDIAPSIVKYPEASAFDLETYNAIKLVAKDNCQITANSNSAVCKLIDHTVDGDNLVLAAMLFNLGGCSYHSCLASVANMTPEQKMQLLRASVENMKFYDQVIREFELAELTFEVVVSSACFGQLKRHRMATLIAQEYDPALGLRIPHNIVEVGLSDKFMQIAEQGGELYHKLQQAGCSAPEYALTNAHQRRVIFKTNLRELYHISRLREDQHSQWDIRDIAAQMVKQAKAVLPITGAFLGGKDKFTEIRAALFAN